jgi:hypothetical protein
LTTTAAPAGARRSAPSAKLQNGTDFRGEMKVFMAGLGLIFACPASLAGRSAPATEVRRRSQPYFLFFRNHSNSTNLLTIFERTGLGRA